MKIGTTASSKLSLVALSVEVNMSNINQLLAKAMSTTSEEEAMSCLRMARKKGKSFEAGGVSNDYNGHDARYWYEKAALYYAKTKEKSDLLTQSQQQQLLRMYKNAEESCAELRKNKYKLEKEIFELKNSSKGWWHIPIIVLQAIIIVVAIQMIR